MKDLLPALYASIGAGAASAAGVSPADLTIKIPARAFDAGCYIGSLTAVPTLEAFPPVLGVCPVQAARIQSGWLYCALSPAFCTALVRHTLVSLPAPGSDLRCYALNRMLALSRHGGTGCPDAPPIRRALLLTLCAGDSRAALLRAENALLSMLRSVPPASRAALSDRCGEVAAACARLLFYHLSGRTAQT